MNKPNQQRNLKLLILGADLLLFLMSFIVFFYFRMNIYYFDILTSPVIWFGGFVAVSWMYVFGTYDLIFEQGLGWLFVRILMVLGVALGITFAMIYMTRAEVTGLLGRGVLIGSYSLFALGSFIMKALVSRYLESIQEKMSWLILGSTKTFEMIQNDFNDGRLYGKLEFINIKDSALNWKLALRPLVEKLSQVSGVIIAFDHGIPEEVSAELLRRKMQGLFITDLTNVYERFWQKVPVFYIGDHWFLSSEGFSLTHNIVGLRLKRIFDLACAISLLLISWPVMLIAMILIKLESKGPAIYSQIRTGKDGHEFTIYKFRSMRSDAEKSSGAVWAQKNDDRITRVGKFIRLTRIDELPQLFNVLKGDMSFIGPRPERPEFNQKLEKDIPYYNLRHLVRPGLTGWAQVMYPYGASIEDSIQKLQFELYYIKNYSFFLDLKIILRTIKVVILGKGR